MSENTIPHWLSRTQLLLGDDSIIKLNKANVLIVGLGGVGAYAAEQLCRSGIGKMTIIDGDIINETNRNRQLIGLKSLQGLSKAEQMGKRLLDINPDLDLTILSEYIRDERMIEVLSSQPFDYVVDCIDTISPKLFLMINALQLNIPIVSSMGSGGKKDPSQIKMGDISESEGCPLARVLRKRLHRRGIYKGIKVVWSAEEVNPEAIILTEGEQNKKSNVGTISYMPPLFGCMIASIVIRDILE